MPRVILVDASIYIFRAWYSVPADIVDRDGEPANAVHGFARFVCDLLGQAEGTEWAFAFDHSLGTSFRNEIYPPYKANRDLPAPEFERQFDACWSLLEAMGLPCFGEQRYEADDIIGSLLRAAHQRGKTVTIVSADKDLSQLLHPGDVLWDFARQRRYDASAIQQKFGVAPTQMVDYLALAGDPVDNIPGVAGIGAKTAAALLAHFGDLDSLLARLEEVPFLRVRGAASCAKRLRAGEQQALLSRRLVQICTDIPAYLNRGPLQRQAANAMQLDDLCQRLRFGPMLRRLCLALVAERD